MVDKATWNQQLAEARAKRKGGPKKKRIGGDRISQAELLYRLRIVEQALIDGMRGGQVMEHLNSIVGQKKPIPYTTVSHYMGRVKDKWEAEDKMLRPIWRERQLRKLHDVAHKLETQAAWAHWIAVQKLIADLEGNLAPVKVEHSHRDEFEGWTLEELREYIASDGKRIPERALTAGEGAGKTGSVFSSGETVH